MRVGFVGWRGMVGSVLMQRMLEERDFDRLEPVFFTTSNIGGKGPAIGRATPPLMSASRVRELHRAGVDFGSHGLSHQRLAQIDPDVARQEVSDSRHRLEAVLGAPVRHFCYPFGSYDEAVVAMVAEAGYLSATTCDRAAAYPGQDLLRLPRKAISFGDNLAGYAWKLHMKNQPRGAPVR